MGSIVSGIGGLFGGGGNPTSNASDISGLQNISGDQSALASQLTGQGNSIYGTALDQYQAGATGQLTPADQALVTQNLGAMNTGTTDAYSSLGLGGSTMESQDLATNSLKSMAEQANLNAMNESLGLSGLGTADQYYNSSNTGYSGAASSFNDAGTLASNNLKELNAAIAGLGNKSSSGLGSGISSILGGATGTSGTGGAIGAIGSALGLGGGDAAGAGIGGDLAGQAALAGGGVADAGAAGGLADFAPLLFAA